MSTWGTARPRHRWLCGTLLPCGSHPWLWRRSQQLEEEQQKALASLSRELESITDVEELTKLVSARRRGATRELSAPEPSPCLTPGSAPPQLRAASEYEERKLIRAAIRKLRAEEIEGEVAVSGLPRRCWDAPSSFLNLTFFASAQPQPWLGTCRAAAGMAPSPQPCPHVQNAAGGMMLKRQLWLGTGRARRGQALSCRPW